MDCNRCLLRAGCRNVVWGKGPRDARFMFIGEAPTPEDELMETPFVSREGKLLEWLRIQSNIPKHHCYLTFAVKCTSKSTPAEKLTAAKECRHWLDKEIAQLKPRVIVTLGRLPTSLLLNLKSKDSMESVVGKQQRVVSTDIPVFPWYSTSYLLQHGKKSDLATIKFLKSLKEFVYEHYVNVSHDVAISSK